MTIQPLLHNRFSDASDEALAVDAQHGNREAYGALIRRHQAAVFSYLLHMVRDREVALDLAQESFVRAWNALPSYDPERRFRTWLFCIATNLSRNHFRGAARFRRACDRVRIQLEWAGGVINPRDELQERSLEQQVRAAVDRLPEAYRQVVWLRYFDDLSSAEIGEIVSLSPAAVDMRLSRARGLLRKSLADLAPGARSAAEDALPQPLVS